MSSFFVAQYKERSDHKKKQYEDIVSLSARFTISCYEYFRVLCSIDALTPQSKETDINDVFRTKLLNDLTTTIDNFSNKSSSLFILYYELSLRFPQLKNSAENIINVLQEIEEGRVEKDEEVLNMAVDHFLASAEDVVSQYK